MTPRPAGILDKLADAPSLLNDNTDEVDAYASSAGRRPDHQAARGRAARRRGGGPAGGRGRRRDPARSSSRCRRRGRGTSAWAWRSPASTSTPTSSNTADKRLRAFGAPNLLVRDARTTLAQIAMARGHLDEADQLASALLQSRLPRFLAASSALDAAIKTLADRLVSEAQNGELPADIMSRLNEASEDEQKTIFQEWESKQIEADPDVQQRRKAYLAYADVVPTSILAGTIELRRAQALGGAARDAMLDRAEKAFLAVKTEAEGQPEFDLGLGEIYARLGRTRSRTRSSPACSRRTIRSSR